MTGFAAYADRLGTTLAGLGGEEMFDSLVEALEHNLAEECAEGHAEGRLGAMMEMAQVLWGPGQEAALEPQPGHALCTVQALFDLHRYNLTPQAIAAANFAWPDPATQPTTTQPGKPLPDTANRRH